MFAAINNSLVEIHRSRAVELQDLLKVLGTFRDFRNDQTRRQKIFVIHFFLKPNIFIFLNRCIL